jgi:hypothetical protein
VVWATTIVSALGILLGLRFRVPMLVSTSVAMVASSCVAALFSQQPLLTTLALTYVLLMALQGGYLVGLALSCARSRLQLGGQAQSSSRRRGPRAL